LSLRDGFWADAAFEAAASAGPAGAAHSFAAGACEGIAAIKARTAAAAEEIILLLSLSKRGVCVLACADDAAEFGADDFPFFVGGGDGGFGLGERIDEVDSAAAGAAGTSPTESATTAASAEIWRSKSAGTARSAGADGINENITRRRWRSDRLIWCGAGLREGGLSDCDGKNCDVGGFQDLSS
jgi:hypothetical protein